MLSIYNQTILHIALHYDINLTTVLIVQNRNNFIQILFEVDRKTTYFSAINIYDFFIS